MDPSRVTWPAMDRGALRDALASTGATISPGMTDVELDAVEARYGFHFAPDHRLMLSEGLPLDHLPLSSDRPSWPDWRDGDEVGLRELLAFPVEGILASVERVGFWWQEWGERPLDASDALEVARGRLSEVPTLVPLHNLRFISSAPALPGTPVFSIYGTDVIHIAGDLLDYLRGFVDGHPGQLPRSVRHVEFWSRLVEWRGAGGA
jgi:hypothetical protein